VSGQLHTPTALPPLPTGQEDGWAPKPAGDGSEEKKIWNRAPVIHSLA